MKSINFLNEKGNVDPKARQAVADMVTPKLLNALRTEFGEDRVIVNACGGGASVALYTDKSNNEVIYLRLDKTITQKSPDFVEKKTTKKTASSPAVIVIPELN